MFPKMTNPSLATLLQGSLLPLSLALAPAVLALDEYLPVPVRVMQIHAGVERNSISGNFQQSWESDEVANPENPVSIPVQGKFGVMDDLEGSMSARYFVNDSSGNTGLDRPVLGLKYAERTTGVGGFLAIALPLGFDDIMNAGNYASLTGGVLYGKMFPQFGLLANASYTYNTEDNNDTKVDNIRLFGKPEYVVPARWLSDRKWRLGASLGAMYQYEFNRKVAGASVDYGGHLFQLIPGVLWTPNKVVSAEVNLYLNLAGQHNPAGNSLKAQLYFTLEEDIYNAL